MAFAMQVAAKQKAVTECPHLSEDAQSDLAGASAPPMKLVHIGPPGDAGFEIGQETAMYRHEDKFQRVPGLAVTIPASTSNADAAARLAQIGNAVFHRVGQELKIALAAVDLQGMAAAAAAARVTALATTSTVPFVLMTEDPAVMAAAAVAVAANKPLLYRATPANATEFAKIAADNKCPLAVSAGSLEELADLTTAAKNAGVEDMVLAFDGSNVADTVRNLTVTRRAALKKSFRAMKQPLPRPRRSNASWHSMSVC